MSDTNRGIIRFIEETVWGTTPATPAMTKVRFVSESLGKGIENVQSAEIRSDRNVTDLVQVGASAQGDISTELSFDNLDLLGFEGALMSDWGSTVAMAEITISAAASDQSFNDSASGFVTAGIVAGQWIKVAGFVTGANNGYFLVDSIVAGKIIVSGGTTLVDESAGPSATIDGTMIRNGITEKFYSMEKEFADITEFVSFTGMMVNQLVLSLASQAIVTANLSFIGEDGVSAGTTIANSSPDAPTNDVFNAVANVAQIREGGAALSGTYAKGLSLTVNNNERALDGIGVLGAIGVGLGACIVTGEMEVYFEDNLLYEKFLQGTASSIDFTLTDADGNTYIITLPNVKYSDGNPVIGGSNSDVMLPLSFQALMDSTLQYTIQVDKF